MYVLSFIKICVYKIPRVLPGRESHKLLQISSKVASLKSCSYFGDIGQKGGGRVGAEETLLLASLSFYVKKWGGGVKVMVTWE